MFNNSNSNNNTASTINNSTSLIYHLPSNILSVKLNFISPYVPEESIMFIYFYKYSHIIMKQLLLFLLPIKHCLLAMTTTFNELNADAMTGAPVVTITI